MATMSLAEFQAQVQNLKQELVDAETSLSQYETTGSKAALKKAAVALKSSTDKIKVDN